MTQAQKTYLGIAIVFVLSLLLVVLLPEGEIVRSLATIPAVGALAGALFQVFRDQAAHEKALLIVETQNRFALGASSHMANIAFDKHVEFCEEYVAEMQNTLITLFREGPTPKALEHSSALYGIQQKYRVWLTPELEFELDRFESALRNIGATAGYIRDAQDAEDRQKRIERMYSTFNEVVGVEQWKGAKLTEEVAMGMVIRRLRAVLGIAELTSMRKTLITKAVEQVQHAG